MVHGLAEGIVAVVAGVVVGEGDGIKTALQNRERRWLGAKVVDFVVVRLTTFGNRTFKIADPVVGLLSDVGKGSERVAALGDQTSRAIVEHDVTSENQVHGFGMERIAE
jgi:hypothetical protein